MTGFAVKADGTGWRRSAGPDDIDSLTEYYMEDKGVDPPMPQPSPAMLIEMALAEVAASTRSANVQVTALQGRVEAISDAIEFGEATATEVAELPVRQTQLTEWKHYRILLGRVATSAGWPRNPNWPATPEAYAPSA